MSIHLIGMAVLLVVALVVIGAVAAKNEKLRTKLAGLGLGIAGALAAVVALALARSDEKKARRVMDSKKTIKDAVKDSKERHAEEVKDVSIIQDEIDSISEGSSDLDALAARMNER
tara:strand:- start:8169 stop:8516 length:348 start_codon:yes stop_codon:yes gene_type:complete